MRRRHPSELRRAAREALRFRLPRSWSLRRVEPDFGIGCLLEIRDRNGQATGSTCRLHLTVPEETEPLVLRLSPQRLEYFRALYPPVLLLRYLPHSRDFYFRWVLSEERDGFGDGADVQVAWGPSDRWGPHSARALERDLRLLRQLRGTGCSWPLRFRVEVVGMPLALGSRRSLEAAVQRRLHGMGRYVMLSESAHEADGTITFTRSGVRAAIGGLHAVSLPEPRSRGVSERYTTIDYVPVLLALLLTRAGEVEAAARLCRLGSRPLALSAPSR